MDVIYNFKRRNSSEVKIGNTTIGAENPVVVQSMANVHTSETQACVDQAIRIYKNGGAFVRFTTPSIKDAENLKNIKDGIIKAGYDIPIVADVHFSPDIADVAALYADKVRINPGNYVRSIRKQKDVSYTDEEYNEELSILKNRFIRFIDICKENKRAIRIGVNHGSLSERIVDRFGDTPIGMSESCMEMLRICKEQKFDNVVLSIKSSNTVVMVKTVRRLVEAMKVEGMNYPVHLGVTEAGEGEDGRIKSALGIGTLLSEGIGDTIRVSLSEEPELEIPVGKQITTYISKRYSHPRIYGPVKDKYNYFDNPRRISDKIYNMGAGQVPIVISDLSQSDVMPFDDNDMTPDYFYLGMRDISGIENKDKIVIDFKNSYKGEDVIRIYDLAEIDDLEKDKSPVKFFRANLNDINIDGYYKDPSICKNIVRVHDVLKADSSIVVVAKTANSNISGEQRTFCISLINSELKNPVILSLSYEEKEGAQIRAAIDLGPNLIDQFADGIIIKDIPGVDPREISKWSFAILQAARQRITKTEYISCPGCGRTLFNLQSTIAKVKEATKHLKGLKIGIMGCIVNGPGEMADADYGYVGAGKGKISLYKNKTCIEKNISEDEAVEKLIDIIKQNGDWREI